MVDTIKYNNFDDLKQTLTLFIKNFDSNVLIQLLINDEFLNDSNNIVMSILEKIDKDTCISIVYIYNNKSCSYNEHKKDVVNFNYRNLKNNKEIVLK